MLVLCSVHGLWRKEEKISFSTFVFDSLSFLFDIDEQCKNAMYVMLSIEHLCLLHSFYSWKENFLRQ